MDYGKDEREREREREEKRSAIQTNYNPYNIKSMASFGHTCLCYT